MSVSTARHRLIGLVTSTLLLALAACSSETATGPSTGSSGPVGGWLTVQLTTPHSDDGAVQFSVTGPAIDSVKLIGYDGFSSSTASLADLVITGTISGGDVARVFVPDLSRTSEYRASVTAAAVRDTYALQTLDGYRAVLVR